MQNFWFVGSESRMIILSSRRQTSQLILPLTAWGEKTALSGRSAPEFILDLSWAFARPLVGREKEGGLRLGCDVFGPGCLHTDKTPSACHPA